MGFERFDLAGRVGAATTEHRLAATPQTCFWGYLDRDQPPVIEVDPGDVIEIEAVTHHAGDAPDLLMDDGIRAIWDGIPESSRAPGVAMTSAPIEIHTMKREIERSIFSSTAGAPGGT